MNNKEGTAAIPGYREVTIIDNTAPADQKKIKEFFQLAVSTQNQVCPVRDIIARISDKWSILAILALGSFGTLRFNELKIKIQGVSQRMLTVTLRNLEADGLLTRTMYPQIPPRVEYKLTALGLSLVQQYGIFTEWANANAEEIIRSRKKTCA